MDFGILRASCTPILSFPRRHHSSKTCRRCEDERRSWRGYPDDGALPMWPGKNLGTAKRAPSLRPGNRHGGEEACGERIYQDVKQLRCGGLSRGRHKPCFRTREETSRGVSRNRRPSTAQDAVGTWAFLALAVQQSGFPAPAIDRRDPSRRPCHWHCALQRQDGGIRRHVAGIHLISRGALLRHGPIVPFRSEI